MFKKKHIISFLNTSFLWKFDMVEFEKGMTELANLTVRKNPGKI